MLLANATSTRGQEASGNSDLKKAESQKQHFLKKQRPEAYSVRPSAQEPLGHRSRVAAANHRPALRGVVRMVGVAPQGVASVLPHGTRSRGLAPAEAVGSELEVVVGPLKPGCFLPPEFRAKSLGKG